MCAPQHCEETYLLEWQWHILQWAVPHWRVFWRSGRSLCVRGQRGSSHRVLALSVWDKQFTHTHTHVWGEGSHLSWHVRRVLFGSVVKIHYQFKLQLEYASVTFFIFRVNIQLTPRSHSESIYNSWKILEFHFNIQVCKQSLRCIVCSIQELLLQRGSR